MQFLYTLPDGSRALRGHPGWLSGTSETPRPLTADELVDRGWGLKVLDIPPTVPGPNYAVSRNPVSQWELGERTATATYTVTELTVEQVRERMPTLTPRQLRLGMLNAGLNTGQVTSALNGNPAGLIEWEYANAYVRTHPLIVQLAGTLGLTPDQVDSLWRSSATL